MIVWRLALAGLEPLSGEGARRVGGRWNSKGRPMIYASEHLSLAVLEILAHLTREELPDLVAHEISIDDSQIEPLGEVAAKRIRRARWSRAVTRAIGDRWFDQRRSLGLRLPSVIVPREANVIINPEHPAAAELEVVSSEPFRFDPRLVA